MCLSRPLSVPCSFSLNTQVHPLDAFTLFTLPPVDLVHTIPNICNSDVCCQYNRFIDLLCDKSQMFFYFCLRSLIKVLRFDYTFACIYLFTITTSTILFIYLFTIPSNSFLFSLTLQLSNLCLISLNSITSLSLSL